MRGLRILSVTIERVGWLPIGSDNLNLIRALTSEMLQDPSLLNLKLLKHSNFLKNDSSACCLYSHELNGFTEDHRRVIEVAADNRSQPQ